MQLPRTELIPFTEDDDRGTALQRLFTDFRVGGLVIPGLIPNSQLQTLVESEGIGFIEIDPVVALCNSLAKAMGTERYWYFQTGTFNYEHEWHTALNGKIPALRLFVHLRDHVELWMARTKDNAQVPFGTSNPEVLDKAFAPPVAYIPEPGDGLLFVDRAVPDVTGAPTAHRSIVTDPSERESFAVDLFFSNLAPDIPGEAHSRERLSRS